MNALFQTKQLALQQKLQAGQISLKQAQQVSQMQQVCNLLHTALTLTLTPKLAG